MHSPTTCPPNRGKATKFGQCVVAVLVAFGFGTLLGSRLMEGNSSKHERSKTVRFDNNLDGITDVECEFNNGTHVSTRSDRNFDGKWDLFEWYQDGIIHHSESDENFNGKVDAWGEFKNGNLSQANYDTDENGQVDVRTHYKHGVALTSVTAPNGSYKFIRIAHFQAGHSWKEYQDTDGDGFLDILIHYDQFGSESRREPIQPPIEPSQVK